MGPPSTWPRSPRKTEAESSPENTLKTSIRGVDRTVQVASTSQKTRIASDLLRVVPSLPSLCRRFHDRGAGNRLSLSGFRPCFPLATRCLRRRSQATVVPVQACVPRSGNGLDLRRVLCLPSRAMIKPCGHFAPVACSSGVWRSLGDLAVADASWPLCPRSEIPVPWAVSVELASGVWPRAGRSCFVVHTAARRRERVGGPRLSQDRSV